MTFETKLLPTDPDVQAPDGSDVRILLTRPAGGMAHFELAAGETSRAIVHRTVEEIWYVLGGRGEMLVDGVLVPVEEGSLVRCAPAAMRAWRNTGDGVLSFCVIQARAEPEVAGEITDGVMGESPVPWPGP